MQRITAFDWACPNIQRANWLYTDVHAAEASSCWQVGHLLQVWCLSTSFLTSSPPWTKSWGNRQLGVLQGQSRWSTPGLDFARWLTTLLARCVKSTCLGNCSPAPYSSTPRVSQICHNFTFLAVSWMFLGLKVFVFLKRQTFLVVLLQYGI